MADAEPRLLHPGEFDELMTTLDRYFSYERGGMAARLPFVYDRDRPERHAVITVDGTIVSHVACVPQTFVVGESASVECHGIGGVATTKPHRGNGYMTALLEFWLDRMADGDVPLAELGGNRERYGHFGWERAGREARYRITPRSAPENGTDGDVTVYDGGDDALGTLRALHGEHDLRVRRDRETARAIYGQRGLETLISSDERGDPRAYVCLSRESRDRTIREFGGTAAGIEALVSYLFEWYDLDSLTAYTHPTHPLDDRLVAMSTWWRTQPPRLVNVRDLPGLLEAYASPLERRWERLPRVLEGELTLGIDGEGTAARLAYGPDGLAVVGVDDDPELQLSRRAAARLLFGAGGRQESVAAEYPVLDALLPLDYYVWHTEHV